MDRADAVSRLKGLEVSLRKHGVASLYLYGSCARNEASAESDLDIFADYSTGLKPDLSRFMDTLRELEAAFPDTEIGFSTREGLVPAYRPHIEGAALRVF